MLNQAFVPALNQERVVEVIIAAASDTSVDVAFVAGLGRCELCIHLLTQN